MSTQECRVLFRFFEDCRYLLHDRDAKYTQSFRAIIVSGRVEPQVLPARSPNLNAYAERWVRSVKEACLSKVILFGERSLRRALSEYVEHYHAERNHQGKDNVLNSDSAAAIRRSRSRGRPFRPVVPTHAPGKLADALRPTGSSTGPIF
jgi:transposase InsO family protein